MKADEVGIYITLIALMYDRGAPLSEDHGRLARQCGTTPKRFGATLETLIVDGKIERGASGLWNKRVALELEWRMANSRRQKDAAQKRWEKPGENNVPSMPRHCRDAAGEMPCQTPESESEPEERDPDESCRLQPAGGGEPEQASGPGGAPADTPDQTGRSPPQPVQQAFEHYNIAARALGLPQAQKLTHERRRKLRARLAEHGLEGWDRALLEVEKSSFLKGHNDSGWRAGLDFLLSPAKFNKVIDGGYADYED